MIDDVRRGAITEIYRKSNRELAAEVDSLKKLVREMGNALDETVQARKDLPLLGVRAFWLAYQLSHDLLAREDVKKIMEAEDDLR